jgi:uncharacterized protein YprB with RNaseH-like and TPR domain
MIENTFVHIDGVSENTEKKLWENGIKSWKDYCDNYDSIDFIPEKKKANIRNEIAFSQQHFDEGNLKYFSEKLKLNEHWRLKRLGKICFVDIETTGLSRWTDTLTVLGIYDGTTPHIYIHDKDIEKGYEKLKEFDTVVTFNGKQFDMPFIEQKSGEKFDFVHFDLRFLLKELGYAGGLKKIEKELGIVRDEQVAEVDGREAVRLWRRYLRGDQKALEILLKYNEEDIVNLDYLLNFYLDEKKKLLGFA